MIEKSKFNIKDQVWVKTGITKQLGVIESVNMIRGKWRYSVILNDNEEVVTKENYLSAYKNDSSSFANFDNSIIGNYFSFLCGITLKRLDVSLKLTNNYYSVNSTRTQFYPHQLKPLIKFIDSENERILICDEVGLGKTIEAGIILKELMAREPENLKNILIICPSNLKDKWWMELYEKFQCDFEIIDSGAKFISKFKKKTGKKHLIISYETIRGDKVSEFLNSKEAILNFDLVILDEAHWMKNSNSKQHKAGKFITTSSERVLLLTATPIQMSEKDLYTLLNILDENEYSNKETFNIILEMNRPLVKAQTLLNKKDFSRIKFREWLEEFQKLSGFYRFNYDKNLVKKIEELLKVEDIEYNQLLKIQENLTKLNFIGHNYTRTRKLDVTENKVVRDAIRTVCEFKDYEEIYYERLTKIIRRIILDYNDNEQRVPPGWITNNYQRQLSSSILAFVLNRSQGTYKLADEISDDETTLDSYNDELNLKLKIQDAIKSDQELLQIEKLILSKNTDSKFEGLKTILSEILLKNKKPKIMLFSFFKATLRLLKEKLDNSGYQVFKIDGDVKRKERAKIVEDFSQSTKPTILLSSRIGTEGLDFQFCDILINYELPWNPMELEQRIGRLDRIGQKAEKIHIYNLYYNNSIEDRIILKLYERIGIFENAIGALEDILESEIKEIKNIYNPTLTDEEKLKILELNEKVILNKKKLQSEADERIEEMLGLDEYFTNKIKKIKNNKQYITPKQLNYILSDFFDNKFKHSMYNYDINTNRGFFKVDLELRKFLNKRVAIESDFDDRDKEILQTMRGRVTINFTLDGITANENHELEFLNLFHPMVKIIIKFYNSEFIDQKITSTYKILLESNNIPPGYYFIYTTVISGKPYLPKNILTTIIINSECKEFETDDYGMDFLSNLLENAQDCPFHHPFKDEDFEKVDRCFKEIMAEKYDEFEEEYRADASRAFEKKKLYIKRTIDSKIARRQEIINKLREKILLNPKEEKNNLPIINMHENKIDQLMSSKEKNLKEINDKFDNLLCAYDHKVKIGILKVVRP